MPLPEWVLGLRKVLRHPLAPCVGKQSLRCGKARAGSRIPEPLRRPGSLVCQALGHPDVAGSHRRTENEVGSHGLHLAGWGREKGELWLVPGGILLGLEDADLVMVVTGSAERSSMGHWTVVL